MEWIQSLHVRYEQAAICMGPWKCKGQEIIQFSKTNKTDQPTEKHNLPKFKSNRWFD